jgi:hypothetical protein
MLAIHILAGVLSILAGMLALFATKGSIVHRRSGLVFVLAMLVMTSSAVTMAAWLRPNMVNVTAGLLTFYLVVTSLLTVRAPLPHARGVLAGLMLVAITVALLGFRLGIDAVQSSRGTVDGVPAAPLFLFGTIGVLAATLDARLLWRGTLAGAHRIARHLWRMTFALWIATTSAFLGQAKFFPQPLRGSGLLAIPVLIVTGMLIYSLVRVLRARHRPAARGARGAATLRAG